MLCQFALFQYFSVTKNILHSGKRNRAFFDDFRLMKKEVMRGCCELPNQKATFTLQSGKNGRVVTYRALHSLSSTAKRSTLVKTIVISVKF